jgi:hypothetical protein
MISSPKVAEFEEWVLKNYAEVLEHILKDRFTTSLEDDLFHLNESDDIIPSRKVAIVSRAHVKYLSFNIEFQ